MVLNEITPFKTVLEICSGDQINTTIYIEKELNFRLVLLEIIICLVLRSQHL